MKFILYNSMASALLGVRTGWINLWYKIPKSRQHKCTAFSPHSAKLFISKRNNPNSQTKKKLQTWSINHLQLLSLYPIKSYKPKKLRCKFQINKLLDIMIDKMFLVTSRQWDMSINLYLRVNQWMYAGCKRGKKLKLHIYSIVFLRGLKEHDFLQQLSLFRDKQFRPTVVNSLEEYVGLFFGFFSVLVHTIDLVTPMYISVPKSS